MLETKLQVSEIQVSYKPSTIERQVITSSHDSYTLLMKFFSEDTIGLVEQFVVVYLNVGNRVLGIYHASTGGITGTICEIRIILGVALKIAATSFIVSHNHPSGNLKPSRADEELTRKLKDAAKVMDLKLLDHLIVEPGGKDYYSFADEGLL